MGSMVERKNAICFVLLMMTLSTNVFSFQPNMMTHNSWASSSPSPSLVSCRKVTSSSHFMAGGDFFSDDLDTLFGGDDEDDDEYDEDEESDEDLSMASEFEDHIPRVNAVTLVGRVGQDPEPKYFDDGKVVLNLSLAVKRKYHPLERRARKIRSGEEETDWWGLEIWGRDAEYASKYVDKGCRLMVTGSLQIDSWTDRNTGEPRTKAKIIVRHLDIMETKAETELRRGNRGGGGGNYFGGGFNDNDDDDGGPSSAGTGGYFN